MALWLHVATKSAEILSQWQHRQARWCPTDLTRSCGVSLASSRLFTSRAPICNKYTLLMRLSCSTTSDSYASARFSSIWRLIYLPFSGLTLLTKMWWNESILLTSKTANFQKKISLIRPFCALKLEIWSFLHTEIEHFSSIRTWWEPFLRLRLLVSRVLDDSELRS